MSILGPSRRITVGVDLTAESESLLRWADHIAALRRATVYAITAVPVTDPELRDISRGPAAEVAIREALEETIMAALPPERADLVRLRVNSGRADGVLLTQARKAELVVLGPHGRGGVHGLLLGSVTERVVSHAGCPVAIVHPRRHPASGRIAVGLDGSPGSQQALVWAVNHARLTDAKVDAFTVWGWEPESGIPPYGVSENSRQRWAKDQLDAQVAALPQGTTGTVIGHACSGNPAAVLVEASADADLIVVGNHGAGAAAGRLLGSVSQKVARHATVPVIVVHDHDHDRPPSAAEQRTPR